MSDCGGFIPSSPEVPCLGLQVDRGVGVTDRRFHAKLTGLAVEPLLVFSDAWLMGRVPAQRRGVAIVPARMLAGHLERRQTMT
jgi:hypothetical protein